MNDFFKELFDYNHYYNRQLLAVIEKGEPQASTKAVQLFNHILNAHAIWISRIVKEKQPFAPNHVHAIAALADLNQDNYAKSVQILQSYDLNERIVYTNTAGQSFTNSVRDILFHVINHSTYHRGQLAMDFRQTGLEPIPSDYIHFKR